MHVCFFPGNIFPGCEGFFSNNHPQDIKRKKTGPNQSHEFGFGETAVIFTTEPFGLLPGRMYLAEIGSDLRPRGALPGGFWILFVTRFFFFGGLFLVGHGIATSGWWFPGGWCCLPGELEPWVFWRVFRNFGDVWPICLTMQSSSLTAMAAHETCDGYTQGSYSSTQVAKKYQLLLKAFLLTNIRLLAVLFFRWRCCWWLQRKKARMVSMVGCNEKLVVAFFLKPGNPSRPFKEIGFHQPKTFFRRESNKLLFVNCHRGMFEKQNEKKHNQNTAHPGNFFSMANFFRTRLRDSLRNGDEWGLSQNWQPCRRCHREEGIFFVWLSRIFTSTRALKGMVFLGIVDEANPQKCPGIPGFQSKNQLQK